MVALSHATARELGYPTTERRRRQEAVRRGVRAQGARRQDRRPARPADEQGGAPKSRSATRSSRAEECQRVGAQIAVARDPLLHAEVLARQADRVRHRRGAQLRGRDRSVPAVRRRSAPNNIFHKLQERDGLSRSRRPRRARRARPPDELTAESDDPSHDLWALVFEASRLDDVVEQVVRSLEFSGPGEIRVRARADSSTRSTIGIRSSTKRTRRSKAVARRRRRLRPRAADARARSDGH